jgi:hypothetical protein
MKSVIEFKGLELKVSLGTYGPKDVVPSAHILELTLTVHLIDATDIKNFSTLFGFESLAEEGQTKLEDESGNEAFYDPDVFFVFDGIGAGFVGSMLRSHIVPRSAMHCWKP